MQNLFEPRRIWPTVRERIQWAFRETSEFHSWKKAALETGVPFVLSLAILHHFLDPTGWRDEWTVGLVSLLVGLVVPMCRFGANLWCAPRQITEQKYWHTWDDYVALKIEQERLLAERIDVEVGGIFVRRANLSGSTDQRDGKVFALQNTIITNRSDKSVSLSFELWMHNTKHDSWLMIREHEHSGMGRNEPYYFKSPINIEPRTSSECKDLGFLLLPRDENLLPGAEYDHKNAVLRVLDRITKKTFDFRVNQWKKMGNPPGWGAGELSVDT